MSKVQIKKNRVVVGNEKISLISGEVHYWRLNPSAWREVLERVKEMGLSVVATYVCWDYHEYEQGKFDFTGKTDPARNLKAFLELTREMGFHVIIRPGPYIYSEWPREGAPEYAFKYHRLHPTFQKFAKKYMTEVMKIIRPFMASQSKGHIIMLQADNEIDPWPDLFGPQYGLGETPGLFQEFMKEHYLDDLNLLNENWGTDYQSFEEIGPFIATMLSRETGLHLKGDKEIKRNIDYLKFKYFYSKKVAEWNVDVYRQLGVDIPIYLNLYPFFYAHDWVEMQSVSDMVGVDLYPIAEFSEDAYEQRKFIDKIRYLKSVSTISYIAEFASGVWHNRHYETGVLTPNHYRLITLSALFGGIAGWNWYMLVNRDNWYGSPINEWGRTRPELFDVFKQMVTLFNDMDPTSLTKITDVGVSINPIQYAARTVPHGNTILSALYDADVDYDIVNPALGVPKKKVIFYSGNQWLDPIAHDHLRQYVERGGTLIAFRDFPRKDDDFKQNQMVGFEEPRSTLFEFKKKFYLQIAKGRKQIEMVSSVYTFGKISGTKIEADLGNYGKCTVGYIKKVGKGKILHFGMEPKPELVGELLDYLGISLGSYSSTRDVKTALFNRGNSYYLIVTNNGQEDKSADIHFSALPRLSRKIKIKNMLCPQKTVQQHNIAAPFTFEIPRKDGIVFEIKSA